MIDDCVGIKPRPPVAVGSRRRKGWVIGTLRMWLGLLLLYCIIIYAQQRKVNAIMSTHREMESAMESTMTMDNHSRNARPTQRNDSSQRLENLLSKYNLSTRDRPEKTQIPDGDRSITFLHIGKTGGSTISMELRNGCRMDNQVSCLDRQRDGWTPNETVASRRIKSYYHIEDIPPNKHYTTILTVVRNPIKRFLSAFAYDHPTNAYVTKIFLTNEEKQRYKCFPSIGHLIQAATGRAVIPFALAHVRRPGEKSNARAGRYLPAGRVPRGQRHLRERTPLLNCTELAELAFGRNASWPVVNATHPWKNHLSFDYRQYYRSMPPERELVVLRHDRLWEDWVEVNRLLGEGNDAYRDWPVVPPFRNIQRNASWEYREKPKWQIQTSHERASMCQLLREEVRTYLTIVMRAINLDDDDLREAAAGVDEACGDRIAASAAA